MGLHKGTPVRYMDGDERQPSRLAMLVWSKADEVAAELEELTKSQVWVDELAYTAEKGASIQQAREFIMSLTHLHRADFDSRLRQASATHDDLCKRGPAVRCSARLNVVRSLLGKDETFLEITTLKFKSMFHTELQEVVLEQGERGRHISGSTIFHKLSFGHRVCSELACKTNRLEVFHLFAVSIVLVDSSPRCFVLRQTAFVLDSCW